MCNLSSFASTELLSRLTIIIQSFSCNCGSEFEKIVIKIVATNQTSPLKFDNNQEDLYMNVYPRDTQLS